MHEPYGRDGVERKKNPCIMVDGVFVRALNENRTRGLPLGGGRSIRTELQGRASFRGW